MYILKQVCESKDTWWWIADWEGDPGRTLCECNAKRYRTELGAKIARAYYTKRYSHIRNICLKIVWVEK